MSGGSTRIRSLQLGHCHSLQHRDRRTAGAAARIPPVRHAGRRDDGGRGRSDRAAGCVDARPVRHRQAGAQRARGDCAGAAISRVNVYSPSAEHREAFAREMSRDGMEVVAVAISRAAVVGADIVCCATTAMKPVFDGDWLEDGQFVVSIANSDVTNKRSEVDRRTYERASSVIVNDWESVIDNDQTELLDPIKDGIDPPDRVHELGDLLNGKVEHQAAAARLPTKGSSITRTIPAWRSSSPRPAASSTARRSGRRQQQDHSDRMAGQRPFRLLQGRLSSVALSRRDS